MGYGGQHRQDQRDGKQRAFKHDRRCCQQGFGTQLARGDRGIAVASLLYRLLSHRSGVHHQRVQPRHALGGADKHHQTCQSDKKKSFTLTGDHRRLNQIQADILAAKKALCCKETS
ncbi:hypothetical protein D3C72_864030 [compost metagenome]